MAKYQKKELNLYDKDKKYNVNNDIAYIQPGM